ncbi:3-keto-5-aminohexanoate cleavage protein [Rhodococcoides yunnanense]|uniref:3-keto-5-aminohexanoate cleavage protein n=1 Tax=Rhodococcoides yunnanense TaxID=278209 RepID=UPI0009331B8C|nr:3-keto-5-aminohexanoate cleavage protein [Rhodococcus yunnanensis]
MKLKACINGPRTPRDHPAVPVSGEQIAAESIAAVQAGAEAIHVHPKRPDGTDSLEAEHVAIAVDAARQAGVPVGVTTGAWSTPTPGARVDAIASWTVLPDFASVNWHEEGASDVARLLLDRGVGVEAGLWNAAAAEAWLGSGLTQKCLRALLEVQPGDSSEVGAELVALTSTTGIPLLLHGQGDACWDSLRTAVELGLATRIGLEDILTLPDGSPATGNADLVAAAVALLP